MDQTVGCCTDHKTNILMVAREVWITERSFQAIGMAYRTLRNSPKFKQVQAPSVEDVLAEPPASKGSFVSMFTR